MIGTKWVYRNKQDQDGIVVRNNARLVTQGYTQVEGLDFGETYALVARLEAIRILLAYACAHNIKLYQMDIKSAFLNGYIKDMIKKFGMIDSKVISTPMGTNGNLDSDASGNMVISKIISVYDWKRTLCDRIKARCHV